MIFQIDFKSGKPVYLQLVDQIRYAAASGKLRCGEPLPSIRPLAEELRVNRNTIAKAYAELEGQGVAVGNAAEVLPVEQAAGRLGHTGIVAETPARSLAGLLQPARHRRAGVPPRRNPHTLL